MDAIEISQQQLGVDTLNQTRSDDHSNVPMVTVDTEADAQLTLQPISWRHSMTKGTFKSFIQAIPVKIFSYRFVTAHGDITVLPDNHRFSGMDNSGERSCRAFDYGNPPLNTSLIKYATIPIYFITARCGADFMRSKGYSVAAIGEHDVTDWKDRKNEDPNGTFDPAITMHPLKQPRATCVNGTPQAYHIVETEKATLIQSTGRNELNCISFPLPAENILDRRWSGNDSYDYSVNTCSGYPELEDSYRSYMITPM
jgi:hypothetical protein